MLFGCPIRHRKRYKPNWVVSGLRNRYVRLKAKIGRNDESGKKNCNMIWYDMKGEARKALDRTWSLFYILLWHTIHLLQFIPSACLVHLWDSSPLILKEHSSTRFEVWGGWQLFLILASAKHSPNPPTIHNSLWTHLYSTSSNKRQHDYSLAYSLLAVQIAIHAAVGQACKRFLRLQAAVRDPRNVVHQLRIFSKAFSGVTLLLACDYGERTRFGNLLVATA